MTMATVDVVIKPSVTAAMAPVEPDAAHLVVLDHPRALFGPQWT
jgi:hypothetical protein